ERRATAEAEAADRRRAEREQAEARKQQLAAEREQREMEQAAAAARQAAREAEAARQAAERKASAERERAQRAERAEHAATEESESLVSTADRRISGSFESNKGRLPMPASGRIVSHFGQYNVEGLTNVKLDNKGINILCSPGAQVRSIFDGEVSAVVNIAGQMVVMVRHGSYISVYCNLKTVSVRQGQKVSTRQALGTVGQDNILQFQLRKETAKLNPEQWLGR
ncbi:MAG: peptidoglycan DD-metalloendopeptidase family protein, partial [Prevotella sp.]|nr:peptidoglycan DD-metalloendopeptidase family protein [Prevotella sp.]